MKNQLLRQEAAPEGGDTGGGTAVATPPTSAFNPDGTFGENWMTSLGDEFSPHADALKPFKSAKDLAKSYLHFRKNGPAYPGEASTPEDVSRYHALAQVPVEGTPTAYGIELPEGASEFDKQVLDRLSKKAHEAHLSAPGFKAVVSEYQAIQKETMQAFADEQAAIAKAAQDDLVATWRGDFEVNKGIVRHLASTLASQAGINPEEPSFANLVANPAFGKMMIEVSKLTKEDSIRTPQGLGDLRAPRQIADSIMDGSDPIWGKKYKEGSDDERVAAYKEVSRLLSMA